MSSHLRRTGSCRVKPFWFKRMQVKSSSIMSYATLRNNTTAYTAKSNLQLSGNYLVAAIKRHKNGDAQFAVEIPFEMQSLKAVLQWLAPIRKEQGLVIIWEALRLPTEIIDLSCLVCLIYNPVF